MRLDRYWSIELLFIIWYFSLRVEVFFAFHPHAGKLFHPPTFLTKLSLPPGHIDFPHIGMLILYPLSTWELNNDELHDPLSQVYYMPYVLSEAFILLLLLHLLYPTSLKPQQVWYFLIDCWIISTNGGFKFTSDDLFQNAYKRRKALPDSFGEIHAKFAVTAIEESTSLGERLFECQQGLFV